MQRDDLKCPPSLHHAPNEEAPRFPALALRCKAAGATDFGVWGKWCEIVAEAGRRYSIMILNFKLYRPCLRTHEALTMPPPKQNCSESLQNLSKPSIPLFRKLYVHECLLQTRAFLRVAPAPSCDPLWPWQTRSCDWSMPFMHIGGV